MEKTLKYVRFFNVENQGASLKVEGLTVIERHRRQFEKLGFVPIASTTAVYDQAGVLYCPADVQVLAQHYKFIDQCIQKNPHHNHQFLSETQEELGIEWTVGPEAILHKHTLCGATFFVTSELKKSEESTVSRLLADALYAEILQGTQGLVARHINKKVSFWMSRYLVQTHLTPNQITVINLGLGILGCLCFLSASYLWQCLGAILLQLNSIVDGCDGEVARLKVITSPLGGWLDTISDDILNNTMFLCLVQGLFWQNQNLALYWFGMASVLASLGVTSFIYVYLIRHNTHNAAHFKLSWEKQQSSKNVKSNWFDVVKVVLKRDFFIFVVFLFILLNIREALMVFLLPVWGAFFLYFASFIHSLTQKQKTHS